MADRASPSLRTSAYRQSLWLSREQPVLNTLKQELAGCGLFIDVGANIGDYTYLANAYLNNAKVICIEPNVDLNPVIEETIRAARSENENNNSFQIINKVISEQAGKIDFYIADNPALSNMNNRTNREIKREIESIPLDSLFEPSRNTFIKMDIEGAEYQALKSGSKFLRSSNTKFLVELHAWGDKKLRKYPLQVATLLFLNGYRVRKIDPSYVFGSHYVFEKGSFFTRLASYLYYFPLFLAQYILYRFFEKQAPGVVNYLRRFKKTYNQ